MLLVSCLWFDRCSFLFAAVYYHRLLFVVLVVVYLLVCLLAYLLACLLVCLLVCLLLFYCHCLL